MQIHFGMSGAFRLMAKDKIREERETTRLVLQNKAEHLLAHLSAMTVEYGGPGVRVGVWFWFCVCFCSSFFPSLSDHVQNRAEHLLAHLGTMTVEYGGPYVPFLGYTFCLLP